ncbi:MAG: iron ABC transporter permease [Acidimicrobiales bacterium]
MVDVAVASGSVTAAPTARRVRRPDPVIVIGGLVVAGLALLPLGYLLIRSSEIGWDRVLDIAMSARVRGLLWRTGLLAVCVTAGAVAIAVPIAWLTVRTDLPFRRFWVVASALPLAIPTYVGGYAFIAALGPRGILQDWLEPLGVESLPSFYGFAGAWLVLTLFTYPYVLLTVRSAIRGLDPGLEEASRLLGQGRWATFRHVVLPQLRPSIAAGSLLVALYTLSDFGAVSMLRFDSFTRAIFVQYRASLDRSTAAVLGLVLVAVTLVVLTGESAARRRHGYRHGYHRLHAGGARRAPVVPLGRWRWPAFAALSVLLAVALVIPLAVIAGWFVRGLDNGEPLRLTTTLIGNSLKAAALGALGAVVCAWPVAVLSVRRGGWLARAVERACWVGHSLPGVVVALSLVFFGARIVPGLYQTLWMLTLAYVVLFLPQALGAITAALLQISPSMEEASRLLGRGSLMTTWRVVLPLARPGLLAGGALVFLTCMKELPATLLLAPTGYPTLATQVWSSTSEAFFARAALPALALVLLSALPMAILVMHESDRGRRGGR